MYRRRYRRRPVPFRKQMREHRLSPLAVESPASHFNTSVCHLPPPPIMSPCSVIHIFCESPTTSWWWSIGHMRLTFEKRKVSKQRNHALDYISCSRWFVHIFGNHRYHVVANDCAFCKPILEEWCSLCKSFLIRLHASQWYAFSPSTSTSDKFHIVRSDLFTIQGSHNCLFQHGRATKQIFGDTPFKAHTKVSLCMTHFFEYKPYLHP